MKMLAAGVGALPTLKPAPRFLAEVRRKIARGENPESMTWQDYVFRPFWLKIPLEAAALVVIIGLVMRSEHPRPTQQMAQLESARSENNENDHVHAVTPEAAAKVAALDGLKASGANQVPAAAPVASRELSLSRESLDKKEKNVGGMQAPELTITGDMKQLADKSAPSGMLAESANEPAAGSRRIPMVRNSDELSTSPPSASSPAVGLVRSIELAQSKLSETVTVHARDVDEVRNRAQQLAARCNGRVVVVPQSKDAPEQTLFIELPQEYVAAFKLELLKTSGSAGSTSATTPLVGVLTGNTVTNNSLNAPGQLGLRDDAPATPNTVLEIRVVTPAN